MDDMQRKRLAELVSMNRLSARKREILRLKEQMADEIPDFSKRYVFADDKQSAELSAFVGGLPFARPGWIDVKRYARSCSYSPNKADIRRVWICFLSGSAELLEIYAGCTAADYFADFEDWQFFSPFTVLAYDDLGGFIFIDDNENMTEVVF